MLDWGQHNQVFGFGYQGTFALLSPLSHFILPLTVLLFLQLPNDSHHTGVVLHTTVGATGHSQGIAAAVVASTDSSTLQLRVWCVLRSTRAVVCKMLDRGVVLAGRGGWRWAVPNAADGGRATAALAIP